MEGLRDLFQNYNLTELYQSCQSHGIRLPKGATRETMLSILSGEQPAPTDASNDLDEWRLAIMGFVLDYWDRLSTQITCPASTKDPLACFGCVDSQVRYCLDRNHKYLNLIQPHRRSLPIMQDNADNITIDNCPRDPEVVQTFAFNTFRRLAGDLLEVGGKLSGTDGKPLFGAEVRRSLFTAPTGEPRARAFVNLLQQYDAASGKGGGGAPVAAKAAPPPAEPQKVDLATAQAVQEDPAPSAAEPAEKPKRTRATATQAPAAKPDVGGGATQVLDLEPVISKLESIASQLGQVALIRGEIRDLQRSIEKLDSELDELRSEQRQMGRMSSVSVYLSALSAACVLSSDELVVAEDATTERVLEVVNAIKCLQEAAKEEEGDDSGKE